MDDTEARRQGRPVEAMVGTADIDDLLDAAVAAWGAAQAACPDRTPTDLDGPTCARTDNSSCNGWCEPSYCPRRQF